MLKKNNENLEEEVKQANQIAIAELLWSAYTVKNNLAFLSSDDASVLFKRMFPDSQIAAKFACKRTKTTDLIKNSLSACIRLQLDKILRTTFFSLLIDMSTDISKKHLGVLVVRYFDNEVGLVQSKLWRVLELPNADHLSIFEEIESLFRTCKIPYENLIGIGTDGAKNLIQENHDSHSLFALLLTRQPRLYGVRCICHSINLVSSHASDVLPSQIERLLRDVYNYFAYSYKTTANLSKVQEEFSIAKHKIVSYNKIRWLSLKNCVTRILQQWNAVKEVLNLWRSSVF
jgi:hypothetical protein